MGGFNHPLGRGGASGRGQGVGVGGERPRPGCRAGAAGAGGVGPPHRVRDGDATAKATCVHGGRAGEKSKAASRRRQGVGESGGLGRARGACRGDAAGRACGSAAPRTRWRHNGEGNLRARGEQVRRARRRVGGGKVWAYGCSPPLGIQAGGSRVDTMEDLCGSGANRYVRTRVAGLGTVARDGDIDPPCFNSDGAVTYR